MKSVKETFLLALKVELSTFKTGERYSICEGYEHYAYNFPSIKYSECGEFEYYDYQYPSKSQHTDSVQIADI